MLIVLALAVLYLKGSGPASTQGPPTAALEATKRRAQEFQEQQKKHFEELQHQLAE
jgi:hypothetical protein